MKTVKITSGLYGYSCNGVHRLKTKDSDPFPLNDAEADRIVGLGIAKIVTATAPDTATATEPTEEKITENTSVNKLREMGKAVGLSFKPGTTKKEMVAAIKEARKSEPPAADDDIPKVDDGAPILTASDPI